MVILLVYAGDGICDGTAAHHDGSVYHPLAYWGRFSSCLHHTHTHTTPQKDHIFSRKDSQKQPKAAHKSPTIPLYDSYAATRGEAQAGAR